MIRLGSNGNNAYYGIKHYNVDTLAELENLNPANETMGTTAFILEGSKYFMVNGAQQWIAIYPYGNAIYHGTTAPADNFGSEGDLYIVTAP